MDVDKDENDFKAVHQGLFDGGVLVEEAGKVVVFVTHL